MSILPVIGGLLIGIVNSYLTFGRPWRYQWQNGTMQGYRHVSGVPFLVTLGVIGGSVSGFGELLTAVLGLVAIALDTTGPIWFLLCKWHDRSLWDE